ncbi:transglutaminase domain-containing protein [Candidatus Woesearchaeota archaeon]|nr:transglutaminase domain-containing protein [Candidatus Woesearchaeota archaeon]
MKKICAIIAIFFLLSLSSLPISKAQREEDYNTYSYVVVDYTLSSNINLNYGSNSKLQALKANLSLVPSNYYMQTVESLDVNSNPNALTIVNKDSIYYEWNEINNLYEFGSNARIKINNLLNKIPHVEFPIKNLDPEYSKYLEPEKIIDINQEIIEKTNSLVQGEGDLFEATFKIADWVKNNIKYDLNTLTESASQKSSWVLQNKEGVCDEITSLFISMLRAAGIPARFVTGMVYTNLNYDYGNHGWAEVYFPEYGWVPFDVTFGEYGWIDPGHIKLSDTLDAGEASIRYSWRSYNIEVRPSELSLKAKTVSLGPKIEPLLKLSIEPLYEKAGPGSYVPLKVAVENPFNYYISTSLTITKAPELTDHNNMQVLLRPLEKRSFFWTIKVPEDIDKRYIFTSQLEVIDTFGGIASSKMEYSSNYNIISLNEANQKIAEYEDLDTNTYTKDLSFTCKSDKLFYYLNDNALISCTLINTGNSNINSLDVCIENNCKTIDLAITGKEILDFNLILNDLNKRIFLITAKNDKININNFLKIQLSDSGPLKIYSINAPSELNYNERFTLFFTIDSVVTLKDIEIKINNLVPLKTEELTDSKNIELPLEARYFVEDPLKIHISYKDQNNREFSLDKEINIKVSNVPWYAKLFLFFSRFF